MTIRLHLAAFLAAVLPCAAAASAGPNSLNADTIYRLDENATYQEGCWEPCACPIGPEIEVRGVFVLGPAMPGDVVDFRDVKDINWRVVGDASTLHTITGTGLYRRTNYGEPVLHALDLDLSIDGGPVQHFFSDFVPATNDGALDITVSINGMFCYDIVIRVDAGIVPPDEITRYTLVDGSTYQQGCWEPCDCPLWSPIPMRGHFALVPIINWGTYAEYAVVQATFVAPWSNLDPPIVIRGNGTYTLIQGFAGPMQAMDMWLSVDGGELTDFDSALENIEPIFPDIDVAVDMNDMVCFDIILTLRARPVTPGVIGGFVPMAAGQGN